MSSTISELPEGISQEDLDAVDVDKLKDAMVKGVYLVELLLFSQAQHEASRLSSTRKAIDNLFSDLYDEDMLSLPSSEGGYTTNQKVELLKLADSLHGNRLKFLSELHKNVASGLDAVKSLERIKPDRGPLDQAPNRKRALKETRRAIEDAMAARVKELDTESDKNKG